MAQKMGLEQSSIFVLGWGRELDLGKLGARFFGEQERETVDAAAVEQTVESDLVCLFGTVRGVVGESRLRERERIVVSVDGILRLRAEVTV